MKVALKEPMHYWRKQNSILRENYDFQTFKMGSVSKDFRSHVLLVGGARA